MKKAFFACFFCFLLTCTEGYTQTFTKDDTLRGSITPERAWWDVVFYDLKVKVDTDKRTIVGQNTIRYRVLKPYQVMQLDLQQPLSIQRIEQDGKPLTFEKAGKNAYFVKLEKKQKKGRRNALTVFYSGKPREAPRAPWDGGFTWREDFYGKPFVATSNQGLGASAWWVCKDHGYDEPDSMAIAVTVPRGVMDVSNGRLRRTVENADSTTTYEWEVKSPINNYGVNINIADYYHWSEVYMGEKGRLTLDYYVLPAYKEKAMEQFKQVPMMLKAFEHWFGPYPFYKDGYKLVEVPYLGMEHQSSVTYGNGYMNGYRGRDLSNTGWGMKWDFIIVHESGHEWFANNITAKDVADMWIQEGFTNYSENLFTEYYHGKDAGAAYVIGTRALIRNDKPIIGVYNVNEEGSSDMYYKGGNLLHTIRQIIDDDEKWRAILRGLNKDFYHQTVTTQDVENYISKKAGRNLQKVFDQYLRTTKIPVFEYSLNNNVLRYRWADCVEGFDMPMKVRTGENQFEFIAPTTQWQEKTLAPTASAFFRTDINFYVNTSRVN